MLCCVLCTALYYAIQCYAVSLSVSVFTVTILERQEAITQTRLPPGSIFFPYCPSDCGTCPPKILLETLAWCVEFNTLVKVIRRRIFDYIAVTFNCSRLIQLYQWYIIFLFPWFFPNLMIYDVIWHDMTENYITPHHTTPHHITSHHNTSHHIISYHITSHHNTPHHNIKRTDRPVRFLLRFCSHSTKVERMSSLAPGVTDPAWSPISDTHSSIKRWNAFYKCY